MKTTNKKDQKHRKGFKKFKGRHVIDRKQAKEALREKRARLVLKNLPFTATEENIRQHFQQYGDISHVELLKKSDGKLVGCAFVQFKLVQFAKQAQHYTNNQQFLGRNIEVDFAKPKNKYEKEKSKQFVKIEDIQVKEEPSDTNIVTVKDETDSDSKLDNSLINTESQSDNSEDDASSQIPPAAEQKKPFMSHDVAEGKTVFIKNVPFDATNEDIKNCMSQFGPLYYALVCMDKLTEHSKGTAFVKFVNKEHAEQALNAGTELTLLGNVLDCHLALDQNELKNKIHSEKEMKIKPKDSRHLYLVKEGVILAGTKASEGVSVADMSKRLQIEQYKTQMLRNMNTFISQNRLVVYNLPATWDDKKLKMLFQKYGGKGAVIKEARIMRDMRNVDAKGTGQSKEFGFVAFTKHENALAALRSLNNNPDIFSSQKRPIVTFSIENKAALNAKIKRLEKSKMKNPKSKEYNSVLANQDRKNSNIDTESDMKPFAGVAAKAGVIKKMRSRHQLKTQAKIHYENIKKEKQKQKMVKKTLNERKKDFIKQPKQKINKKNVDDNFSKLVNNYKKMLTSNTEGSKSKWYE